MEPAAKEKVSEKNPMSLLNWFRLEGGSFCGCGFAGGRCAVQDFGDWLCAALFSSDVARLLAVYRDGQTGLQPECFSGFVSAGGVEIAPPGGALLLSSCCGVLTD